MSTSVTWKSIERKIAHAFGTRRNPLSGSNGRHSKSDTLHPELYIEIKHGKPRSFRFYSIWERTKEFAKEEDKIPILIFHPIGTRITDSMVVLRLGDLLQLIQENERKEILEVKVRE